MSLANEYKMNMQIFNKKLMQKKLVDAKLCLLRGGTPSKPPSKQSTSSVPVPVPVYCRPLMEKEPGMKVSSLFFRKFFLFFLVKFVFSRFVCVFCKKKILRFVCFSQQH